MSLIQLASDEDNNQNNYNCVFSRPIVIPKNAKLQLVNATLQSNEDTIEFNGQNNTAVLKVGYNPQTADFIVAKIPLNETIPLANLEGNFSKVVNEATIYPPLHIKEGFVNSWGIMNTLPLTESKSSLKTFTSQVKALPSINQSTGTFKDYYKQYPLQENIIDLYPKDLNGDIEADMEFFLQTQADRRLVDVVKSTAGTNYQDNGFSIINHYKVDGIDEPVEDEDFELGNRRLTATAVMEETSIMSEWVFSVDTPSNRTNFVGSTVDENNRLVGLMPLKYIHNSKSSIVNRAVVYNNQGSERSGYAVAEGKTYRTSDDEESSPCSIGVLFTGSTYSVVGLEYRGGGEYNINNNMAVLVAPITIPATPRIYIGFKIDATNQQQMTVYVCKQAEINDANGLFHSSHLVHTTDYKKNFLTPSFFPLVPIMYNGVRFSYDQGGGAIRYVGCESSRNNFTQRSLVGLEHIYAQGNNDALLWNKNYTFNPTTPTELLEGITPTDNLDPVTFSASSIKHLHIHSTLNENNGAGTIDLLLKDADGNVFDDGDDLFDLHSVSTGRKFTFDTTGKKATITSINAKGSNASLGVSLQFDSPYPSDLSTEIGTGALNVMSGVPSDDLVPIFSQFALNDQTQAQLTWSFTTTNNLTPIAPLYEGIGANIGDFLGMPNNIQKILTSGAFYTTGDITTLVSDFTTSNPSFHIQIMNLPHKSYNSIIKSIDKTIAVISKRSLKSTQNFYQPAYPIEIALENDTELSMNNFTVRITDAFNVLAKNLTGMSEVIVLIKS